MKTWWLTFGPVIRKLFTDLEDRAAIKSDDPKKYVPFEISTLQIDKTSFLNIFK